MLWKLSAPKPNGPLAAQLFLRLLNVKLSAATLQDEVESHPDYPSLLSISDVFSKYNIENITASFQPWQMKNIPAPYITQLKGAKEGVVYFTVVREIAGGWARMFDPETRKWTSVPQDDLANISTGVVLMADPMPDAGEPDYIQKRREENVRRVGQSLLAALLLAILGFVVGNAFAHAGISAMLPVMYFLTSVAGLGLGILLLWYELDRYNPVIRQICKATRKVNCDAILQSGAAKFGGVSWSMIGLSYFTGTVLLHLLYGIMNAAVLAMVAASSLVAFPFTVYSIYYQWRIAKQWCMLCLYVQGVLGGQTVIALSAGWMKGLQTDMGGMVLVINAAILFILPLLSLMMLVPVLKTAKTARRERRALNRLKYNPIVFDALLTKQRKIQENTEGIGIVLGTPGAANKIVKVCNPYCGPCAKAHVPIEDLLQKNPDVELRIIFTASTEVADSKRLPVSHFLSIAAMQDKALLKQALDDWYLAKEKNYEAFAAKYPIAGELSAQNDKISAMSEWCDAEGITATPTIFINDRELPELYNAHDLKNFFTA